ncbi:trehalose-phosphatase [Sphingomonas radiodurans]|uniref:trehalose-phosphatase n=1 Tax=Sphingomonas radiodurans TaxID=2890321 RepID=UPI001E4B4CE3|nr:trehalose-phosphatase [Sphingomonas radiodurans]WBH16991.1 trehalose-phosphatase [Sphingomonas radiodurans]
MASSPPSRATPPSLQADRHCLLLDFDGTLVEIVDRPDAVVVDEALARLLERLVGTFAGRVALVSGRSVAQIEGFLGATAAGIAVVGSHGAELRLGGHRVDAERPTALVEAERALDAAFAGVEGVVIEVKSLGVAVHYRLAPRHEAEARRLAEQFVGVGNLVIQEGKMMVELRVGGRDKGSGIAALLEKAPFAGHLPVFLGDDVTDEAGFVAVAERGGFGVLVGAERTSAARFRLPDVAAVRGWLGAAA